MRTQTRRSFLGWLGAAAAAMVAAPAAATKCAAKESAKLARRMLGWRTITVTIDASGGADYTSLQSAEQGVKHRLRREGPAHVEFVCKGRMPKRQEVTNAEKTGYVYWEYPKPPDWLMDRYRRKTKGI